MEPLGFSNMLPLAFCILLVLLFRRLKNPKFSDTIKLPPGPWKLPIIGNIHHFSATYHTEGCTTSPKNTALNHIVITSPELALEVMKTHDINTALRPQLHAGKIIFYDGSNITFSPCGKYWSQLRKICTVELLSAKRVESFSFIRKEEVEAVVNKIRIMGRGSPVNLTEMFLCLASTTVARAAIGKGCAHQKKIINAMREAFEHLSGFDFVDLFPSSNFIGALTGFRDRLERVHQHLDEILDVIFEEHRSKKVGGEDDGEDIVDVLFRRKNNGELVVPLTTDNIKAVILDLFLGGTDTTSSTMEWAMSELIKHPNVMQKVQSEVRNALKEKENMEEKGIIKLPYLNQVIKETLRLHPVVHLLVPRLCRETIDLEGYTIPAETRIVINAWAIMREPSYWVNAESFQPERFEESEFDFKGSKFEYIPFGSGRRICPGIAFAIANMEYWLAQLLFHFDWKLPGGKMPEELDMKETFGVVASRKNDLLLIATPHK